MGSKTHVVGLTDAKTLSRLSALTRTKLLSVPSDRHSDAITTGEWLDKMLHLMVSVLPMKWTANCSQRESEGVRGNSLESGLVR